MPGASMSWGDEHGRHEAAPFEIRAVAREHERDDRTASRRGSHLSLEQAMKKSILLLLVLAGAALTGCVHPTDLDTIAPAAKSAAAAN